MNKKLIKTIASITFGLGIAASIPFISTSCKQKSTALPKEVYHITSEGVLTGFETEFLNNMDKYSNCNTMLIPDEVTAISDGAFLSEDNQFPTYITNLAFSESSKITSIGESAFCYCFSLVSVDLSQCAHLKTLGDYAFDECESITFVSLPSSLTSISFGAFAYCSKLTSINFPASITEIGERAFEDCYSLESVDLSKCTQLGLINDDAFKSNSSLKFLKFPSSLTAIGEEAFENCSALTTIHFPSSLQSIGSSAFRSCTSVASIFFPSSLTEIGSSAFSLCSSLNTITFPEDNNGAFGLATNLGTKAFVVVKKLTDGYIWSSENGVVGSLSCGKISLPNDLTQIAEWAFSGCSGITNISFPSTLTFIGKHAFSNCNDLKTVDLSKCTNLETLSESS